MPRVVQIFTRRGIYYGWLIVLILSFAGFMKAGFTGYLFSVFLKPMSEDFGWARSLVAGSVTVGTLLAGALGIFFGRVLDRYGGKWLFGVGGIVMGLASLGLSQINSLWQYYTLYIIGRVMAMGAMSDSLAATVAVKWFVARRGTAVAIASMGGPFGGTVLAFVAQFIINAYGWREAWAFFGLLILLLLVAPVWLFIYRNPEDVGLTPLRPIEQSPSMASGVAKERVARPVAEVSWTFGDAVRTSSFWLLTSVFALSLFSTSGITFNLVAHLTDEGVSATVAVATLGIYAIAQSGGYLAWGILLDRLDAKGVVLLNTALTALAVIFLWFARSPLTLYPSALLLGFVQGGIYAAGHVLWAQYFGRRYLGGIRGLSLLFQTLGNAFGPLLVALIYDISNTYSWAFLMAVIILVIIFINMYLTKPPVLSPLYRLSH